MVGKATDNPAGPTPPGAADERAELALRLILAAYLVLGALYAVVTPAWQVPDEPAHYNYVRYVAESNQLPELRPGDFPLDYLELIKSRGFPPDMLIDTIRYESHQPPLYYILGAVVYRVTGPGLGWPMPLALRGFSLLLGALALWVDYRIVRQVLPEPALALGTVAFAALLPMHLAMTAAVNNDVLVELVLAVIVWQLVSMRSADWTRRRAFALGALLGIALLTKTQSAIAVGLGLVALAWDTLQLRWIRRVGISSDPSSRMGREPSGRRRPVVGDVTASPDQVAPPVGTPWHATFPVPISRAAGYAAVMLSTALLIALPWLVRNMALYGLHDPLALARHDQVVMGQLTTAQYLAQHSWSAYLRAFIQTTFQSFWGQFGWMGVLLDQRLYLALAALSVLVAWGLLLYLLRLRREATRMSPQTRRGLVLLLAWAVLSTLVYLWWNTKYVQFQGRYLFPALVPWGLAFALGIRELLRRPLRLVLVVPGVGELALLAWGLLRGDVQVFSLALLLVAGALLALGQWLARRRAELPFVLLYLGMAVLAVACLYLFIVPALHP